MKLKEIKIRFKKFKDPLGFDLADNGSDCTKEEQFEEILRHHISWLEDATIEAVMAVEEFGRENGLTM